MFLRFLKILTYFDNFLEQAIDKLHKKKFGIQNSSIFDLPNETIEDYKIKKILVNYI